MLGLEVFPADDVGACNNLHRLIGLESDAGYDRVRQAVARWAPYSGLVYFHLLLGRLEEAGSLTTDPPVSKPRVEGEVG